MAEASVGGQHFEFEPLLVAREMMQAHHVRHLPVKSEGKLVSIITDRDIKFALDPELGMPPRETMRVREVCVFTPYIVDIETRLDVVLQTMAERPPPAHAAHAGWPVASVLRRTWRC